MPFVSEYIADIHICLREALTARFILKGIPEPLFCDTGGDIDSHAFPIYKRFLESWWPKNVIYMLKLLKNVNFMPFILASLTINSCSKD